MAKPKVTDAYIITGNPDVTAEHADRYAKFYDDVKKHVESLGLSAEFDPGLPNTAPPGGKYWIGHSRGVDRLKYAPKGVQTLALDDYEPEADRARQAQDYERLFKELGVSTIADVPLEKRPKPGAEHYTFNDAQRNALTELLQKKADDISRKFQPDYTPEQLENLGVYDSLYRGQGPRLASAPAYINAMAELRPKTAAFSIDDADLAQYVKEAMSRWRRPENLQKILELVENAKLKPEYPWLSHSGEKYKRLDALQQAVDHLGLDRQVGKGYEQFVNNLRWRDVPEKARDFLAGPQTAHAEPRYLMRGISPGTNIVKPFENAAGKTKDYIHATPIPGIAMHPSYFDSFGRGKASPGVMQLFRPRANQSYFPDFYLEHFNDDLSALTAYPWNKTKPILDTEFAKLVDSDWAKQYKPTLGQIRQNVAEKHLYETPIFPDNKGLGTFFVRKKPNNGPYPDASTNPNWLQDLVSQYEVARIPQSRKTQAARMGVEQNKIIQTRGADLRQDALDAARKRYVPPVVAPTPDPTPTSISDFVPAPAPASVAAPAPKPAAPIAPPSPPPKSVQSVSLPVAPKPAPAPVNTGPSAAELRAKFQEQLQETMKRRPTPPQSPRPRKPAAGVSSPGKLKSPKRVSSGNGGNLANMLFKQILPATATGASVGGGLGAYLAPKDFKTEGATRGAVRGAATGTGAQIGKVLGTAGGAKGRLLGALLGGGAGYGGSGLFLGKPSWQKTSAFSTDDADLAQYVKEAISAKVVQRAAQKGMDRVATGQISPERMTRFVNRAQSWLPGALDRAHAAHAARVAKTQQIPGLFSVLQRTKALPDSIQQAFLSHPLARESANALAERAKERRLRVNPSWLTLSVPRVANPVPAVVSSVGSSFKERSIQPLRENISQHFGSNAHFHRRTNEISGRHLSDPATLFHELGHGLDLAPEVSSMRNQVATQPRAAMADEVMAWRRGSQMYDTWRKALPAAQQVGLPTQKQFLAARKAPLETYRLGNLAKYIETAPYHINAMAQIAPTKTAALSSDVTLQPHQERVMERTQEEDPRLLVYHGLGSGKSLSAIAAAEAARQNYGHNYGVVLPASLRGNFQKELKKFAPGSNPEIMSYTGLALGKNFQQQPDTLIMDEAQRLRNPESAAARAARDAARKAKRVLLLSGTPVTNSPSDMASLLSMLQTHDISPKDFEKRYIGYKSKFPGIIPWLRGAQWGEVPYVRNEHELRKLLSGKIDYQPSKLPEGVDVQEKQIHVPLSKAQQKIQKALRTQIPPGFLWKIDKEFPMSREELAKMNSFLTGLRQVSLSTQPFRADRDPMKAFEQSSKLQEAFKNLRATLESDPRKKALIYSNFIDSGIEPYSKALTQAGIPYGVFHGGVPAETRQRALRDYNEGKLRTLLIGPAGAEGISTKGTNLIQLLDPHWNEARLQQARGRGLRFDSHAGLPEDLRDVEVQRYLSQSEEPGFLGKLMGQRRQRTGDEVLETLSKNKEQLNEAFRKILQDVGREKYKKDDEKEENQDANTPVRKAASLAARENVKRVSMFPRKHWALGEHADTPINLSEARQIYEAMRGQAPHGALDRTQVHLNGADFSRIEQRISENPRLSQAIRNLYANAPLRPHLRDVNRPDSYYRWPDVAINSSGQGGVLMHELGHAMDFNSHPNTGVRKFVADMYHRFGPRVWQEHAAWRKGREAFMAGAAQNNLSPELVTKVLNNAAKTKPMGMGSYYGDALGKLLGLGTGGGLGYRYGGPTTEGKVVGALLGGGLGYGIGQPLGAGTGLGIGKLISAHRAKHMPKFTEKHLAEYAKAKAALPAQAPQAAA